MKYIQYIQYNKRTINAVSEFRLNNYRNLKKKKIWNAFKDAILFLAASIVI